MFTLKKKVWCLHVFTCLVLKELAHAGLAKKMSCGMNFYCFRHNFSVALISALALVSKQTRCLMSTETIRLIRDGEKWGKGVWRRGERELYTY